MRNNKLTERESTVLSEFKRYVKKNKRNPSARALSVPIGVADETVRKVLHSLAAKKQLKINNKLKSYKFSLK